MTFRKKPSVDILLDLFNEVGVTHSVTDVLIKTGIKNYNTLKSMLSYVRTAKHVPKENRIDIRMEEGICRRVK